MPLRLLIWTAVLGRGGSTVAGVAGAAEANQMKTVNFPSDGVKEVASPSGVTVYYVDPGRNADRVDDRPILLRYPTGQAEQIDSFGRHADVSWSPSGDDLTITNWIGSNVADCTAVTPSPAGAHKRSLTELIADAHVRKVSRDLREGDHVYVSCNRWLSPSRVRVEVRGYGCNRAPCTPRSFDHFLIYDFRTGRILPTNCYPAGRRPRA